MSRCLDRRTARRPNGRSTNALIAKKKRTAAFGLERSTPEGIVARSFASEMASWYARSPMLAPNVARRSNLRRLLAKYKANTKRRKGKLVEQPHGYGSNVNAFVAAHTRTAQGATFVMRPVKTTGSKPVKARQIHGKPQQGSSPTCPNHPPKNCLMLPSERNGRTSPARQLQNRLKSQENLAVHGHGITTSASVG